MWLCGSIFNHSSHNRNTVATIAAHRASRYCVLLFLCVLSVVWQNTGHLRVAALGRGFSYMRVARGLGTELQDR